MASQDEWPSFAHSYTDSLPAGRWSVAWLFFASMAVILGVITPNLFISIICYAFRWPSPAPLPPYGASSVSTLVGVLPGGA